MAFGHSQKLNEELVRLTRVAEYLVTFATNNQIADEGCFVRKFFCTELDVSSLQFIKADTVNQQAAEQKNKLDI